MKNSRKQLLHRMMEGNRLAEVRIKRNLSQEALAEAIGTTARSINRWEHTYSFPQPYYLERLCQVLQCTPEELFGANDDPSQETNGPASLWYVPYARNPFFTGREDILQRLHQLLSQKHSLMLTQSLAVNGLGGIGKTQIALEYAHRYRQEYASIFWASAATRETLLANFVAIAEHLQLPEQHEQNQGKVLKALRQWFATHDAWLLILDNADDVALASEFVPAGGSGHLLLTSRAQALGSLAQSIEIERMGMVEGTLFLLHRAKLLAPDAFLEQASEELLAAAEAIVIELDFLPLALDQAGAYMEEVGCLPLDYLELYRSHRVQLLQRRGNLAKDYPASVATTWSLSFQKVEQANPLAAECLRLCAFLESDTIPEELLSMASTQTLEPTGDQQTIDPFRLNEAIEELRKFSLIQRNPASKTLRIHRLVQAVLKDAIEKKFQTQWAERVVRATGTLFPGAVEIDTWPQCQRYLPQAQVCSALIQEYHFAFVEAADLLHRTASYLHDAALYDQAETPFLQALQVREQVLGPKHVDVAASLGNLAILYCQQGKYEQAELSSLRALRIQEQNLGANHPDVARSLHFLAITYDRCGKYEQAESFGLQALSIQKQILEPTHPHIVASLQELGATVGNQGKHEQAEAFFCQALRIQEQTLGLNHLSIVPALNGLAIIFAMQKKYEQAQQMFERALGIREQTLGRHHADTAESLNNLASVYEDQGKYDKAVPLYQRAISIWEKALGAEHSYLAYSITGLADIYTKQKEYEQAEPLYQRALHIREQTLGLEHTLVAHTLTDLAHLYREQKNYEQASSLYQRALVIQEQAFGAQHATTLATQAMYTELLREMEQSTSALHMETALSKQVATEED